MTAESILSVLAELWMHQNGASGEVLIERKERTKNGKSHGLPCNGKSGRGKLCHVWEWHCSHGMARSGHLRHVLLWQTEVSYGRSPNGSQKRRDGGEKTERRECMKVINSWKIEKYPVSADAAKAEFDRIYEKYGELTTSAVVDESRDEMSVLHNCFEWDDEIAAERFRQRQAGDMIRCLVSVVVPDEEKQPLIVRAIVKTTERYEPISVAMRSEEKTAVLLQDALADIRRFKQKHGALKQLAGVFEEMQKFEDNILNGGAA